MTMRDSAALVRARQMFGLTVDDMAARLGLPAVELGEVEDGRRDLSIKDRNKIERVMGFNLEEFEPKPAESPEQFTPQPYPLFLADWNHGQPLIGRIIGWSNTPTGVPTPVVVFEDQGETWIPVKVGFAASRKQSGPSWIRDSYQEAKAAANAYVPPATPGAPR